jgi:hypothetical protein
MQLLFRDMDGELVAVVGIVVLPERGLEEQAFRA